MKKIPVVRRRKAEEDIDSAFEYYLTHADASIAIEFVNALETAVNHISVHPFTGSTRYEFELEIEDLRSWPLQRFPYLLFFFATDSHVEVLRVLHTKTDIPLWMQDTE